MNTSMSFVYCELVLHITFVIHEVSLDTLVGDMMHTETMIRIVGVFRLFWPFLLGSHGVQVVSPDAVRHEVSHFVVAAQVRTSTPSFHRARHLRSVVMTVYPQVHLNTLH